MTNCLPYFQLAAKSLWDQMLLDALLVPFFMSVFLMTTCRPPPKELGGFSALRQLEGMVGSDQMGRVAGSE